LLNEIKRLVVRLEHRFDDLYEHVIIKELASHRIFMINEHQLNVQRGEFVRRYFRTKVLPNLVPVMPDGSSGKAFPELKDRQIYFLVKLTSRQKKKYALLEMPISVNGRFLVLPETNNLKFIILLDDIIR